jgi:hypothetical protein
MLSLYTLSAALVFHLRLQSLSMFQQCLFWNSFAVTNECKKLEQLNTRIHYTDDKINKLVYGLYGSNEKEVGIVEGK